jgi:hypothetical protein
MSGAASLTRPASGPDSTIDGQLSQRLHSLGIVQPDQLPTGLLGRLRAMAPSRPLGWRAAEQLAERQANRLRSGLESLGPLLREDDIAGLPWVTITRRENLPTSGLATKTDTAG